MKTYTKLYEVSDDPEMPAIIITMIDVNNRYTNIGIYLYRDFAYYIDNTNLYYVLLAYCTGKPQIERINKC